MFEQNLAGNGASAVYAYGFLERYTTAILSNSVFTNSRAVNNCLVYLWSCSCVGLVNTTFSHSVSSGLCISDVSGSCEGSNTFLFNRSTIATSSATDSTISDFFVGDVSIGISVDIRDSSFSYLSPVWNTHTDAFGAAGAIVINQSPYVVLNDITATNNVGRQGAAIQLDAVQTAVIWIASFVSNIAAYEGGAVAMVDSHGQGLLLAEVNASNNSALSGGAVYGGPGTSINIIGNTNLTNNTALRTGGAISATSSQKIQIQNSTMDSNMAWAGGGLYCDQCVQVILDTSQFVNNK